MGTILVIKISTQERTFIIRSNYVQTDDIASVLIFTFQMPVYVLIGQRGKIAVGTLCTFMLFLVTYSSAPFVDTYRLVTTLFCGFVEPSSCKYIIPSLEKVTEQCNFLIKREFDWRICYGRKCCTCISTFDGGIHYTMLQKY